MSLFTKKLLAFCAALVLLALMVMALPTARVDAQSAGQGKIDGQVVNGTKGAQPSSTAGLTVTLLSVAQGATGMISSTAQTDANGRFSFSDLSTVTTTQYLATTSYTGIPYYSDPFTFDGNQTTVPLSMTVYETTNDPSVIRVNQTHLILDVQTRLLNVTQVVVVEGTSDRVLVGATATDPHKATLVIPILEGATDAQIDNPPEANGTTLQGNGVLTYTERFYPGDHLNNNIVMRYAVPFNPPMYSANLKLPYDTATLRILAADVGQTIQANPLSAPTPFLSPAGSRFIQTSGSNLKAGTTISVTMTNLPATVAPPPGPDATAAPAAAPTNNNLQLVGGVVLGVAALAALALLLYPVLRRRQERAAPVESTADERMELLQAMADLDDEFEAGKISEAEYKEERARLKAELLELPSRGEE
jgi:hypothetical protein